LLFGRQGFVLLPILTLLPTLMLPLLPLPRQPE
jgi:hypothetical protein